MVTRPDEAAAQNVDQWHKLKEEGNKLFKDGSHLKAAAAYTTAIKVRQTQSPLCMQLNTEGHRTMRIVSPRPEIVHICRTFLAQMKIWQFSTGAAHTVRSHHGCMLL